MDRSRLQIRQRPARKTLSWLKPLLIPVLCLLLVSYTNNLAHARKPEIRQAVEPEPYLIYLPIIMHGSAQTFTISGTVRTNTGNGVAGVLLALNTGSNTTSNALGEYSFSGLYAGTYQITPAYQDFVFVPDQRDVVVGPNAQNADFVALGNRLINGNFEADEAWVFSNGGYTSSNAHSGNRSALLGIIDPAQNAYLYSYGYQAVVIPAALSEISLTCYIYTTSSPDAPTDEDQQYIRILDSNYNVLATLWSGKTNSQQWEKYTFKLSDYLDLDLIKGQTLYIFFGVFNDGYENNSALYVDDAAIYIVP